MIVEITKIILIKVSVSDETEGLSTVENKLRKNKVALGLSTLVRKPIRTAFHFDIFLFALVESLEIAIFCDRSD
jgi:hypothetical protein